MKKKNKIILIAVNALLLALIAVCLLNTGALKRELLTQSADERWSADSTERFAQVSLFYPQVAPGTEEAVFSFRAGLDKDLADTGLEQPETGSYWTDAYSTAGELTVKSDRGAAEATAVGVGGNFFLFHPYELMDGSYIYEADLMKDRVVLDYELAWELFGSADLAGMTVSINDVPYYIAGVIRRESDRFTERVYEDEPLIFMSYSAYLALDETAGVTCYELVIADPITGYAQNLLEELGGEDADVVENSARYDFSSIFSMFTHFGDRSIDTKAVAYPYWENAARVCEVYIARDYVFAFLLALFPLATLVWLIARLIKYLRPRLKKAKAEVSDAWDDRYYTMNRMEKARAARKARGGRHAAKKPRRRKKAPAAAEETVPDSPPEDSGAAAEE